MFICSVFICFVFFVFFSYKRQQMKSCFILIRDLPHIIRNQKSEMRSCYGRVFNEGFRNIIVDTVQVVVDICWLIQYVLSYCCVTNFIAIVGCCCCFYYAMIVKFPKKIKKKAIINLKDKYGLVKQYECNHSRVVLQKLLSHLKCCFTAFLENSLLKKSHYVNFFKNVCQIY